MEYFFTMANYTTLKLNYRPYSLVDFPCPFTFYLVASFLCGNLYFRVYNPCGHKEKLNERGNMKQKGEIEEQRVAEELRLLSVKQVSEILGLSHNGTYDLINTKKIKSVKIGARRLFTTGAVKEYIEDLEKAYEA